jgi:formylglycine-generating enzyme required for sulfatase activity
VGFFAPNGYGLFDMAGNEWEWCWDWYGTPYGQPTASNPTGPSSGTARVLRGGDGENLAHNLRCAVRNYNKPADVTNPPKDGGSVFGGFRCVTGI